jgi:serine-type D-Ala-D-Ala carboxypeptidase/endopeptidase
MRFIYGFAILALLASRSVAQQEPPVAGHSLPSDTEIQKILADRIDILHKSTGMVVGIVTPNGRRIISYGRARDGDATHPDGDTVFEIGSVTKVFTALALADMWLQGEVSPEDPVSKYLPSEVKVPERNGRAITLADLATQTSGLPFFPSDFPENDPSAYAAYSLPTLYGFLSSYTLSRDPGAQWEYSNLGYGILGNALARRAGVSYAVLIRDLITTPLGMTSTAIDLSPSMRRRFATGHDAKLHATPQWSLPSMEGAGSLRSTANDLLKFLAAFADAEPSALSPAMAKMLEIQRPGPGFHQALGWWVFETGPGSAFETHEGATFGYSCTIAYDAKSHTGVVVLSNSVTGDGGLAWHLLRPSFPLETSAALKVLHNRKEIQLAPELLRAYVGRYQSPSPGGIITIEQRGNHLFLKTSSAPQGLQLHAESDSEFFVTETDLQVSFQRDTHNRITALVVHFAGRDNLAKRLADEP